MIQKELNFKARHIYALSHAPTGKEKVFGLFFMVMGNWRSFSLENSITCFRITAL